MKVCLGHRYLRLPQYPGYRPNLDLEGMDYGSDLTTSPRLLINLVTHYPGIKPDLAIFDDEYNSIGPRAGNDDSMQAKYLIRGVSLANCYFG
jgi:hypothetical protein